LVAVLSGAVTPTRGVVLVDGAPLATTPDARRRVASLLDAEALPFARDVDAAVARALAARGDAQQPHDVLAPLGLDTWSRRAPSELDRDELRSVALALALSHERADVLVLYEPLAPSASPAAGVEAAVRRCVERGAVVVVATASRAGALRWGGPHCAVDAGVLSLVAREGTPASTGAAPASTGAAL
jgi:ABC-type thiamine transport system ATPase subunit